MSRTHPECHQPACASVKEIESFFSFHFTFRSFGSLEGGLAAEAARVAAAGHRISVTKRQTTAVQPLLERDKVSLKSLFNLLFGQLEAMRAS